jgi:hypothetical protein
MGAFPWHASEGQLQVAESEEVTTPLPATTSLRDDDWQWVEAELLIGCRAANKISCLRCKVHDVRPVIVQYAMDEHP